MTVIARFEVIPVGEESMAPAIASALRALDNFPVSYRTTPTDTIIEADAVEQVFAAVQAAHNAIPDGRVITSLEVDEDRRRPQTASERVASVERALGHPAQRQQPAGRGPQPIGQGMQQQLPLQYPTGQTAQPGQMPAQSGQMSVQSGQTYR